jgi:acetyl-CoA carboxylase carboxyl transferase subunit alpha
LNSTATGTDGDDAAIVGGIAKHEWRPVTVIANQKGRTLKEKLYAEITGWQTLKGYRRPFASRNRQKSFIRPIITFIDTSGAYPGLGAEERALERIARKLRDFSQHLRRQSSV